MDKKTLTNRTSWRIIFRRTLHIGFIGLIVAPIQLGWSQSQPHKLALLVGIDDYLHVPDLDGAVNDVKNIHRLLVEDFSFPDNEQHIRILTNEGATRDAILSSIRDHLIAQAKPDSIVVFHYSGHGSHQKDSEGGDEVDGFDETIVTHESGRGEKPNSDITDDELNALLIELSAKTPNVTFIMDSCHSGTATRASAASRWVEADNRPPSGVSEASSSNGTRRDGESGMKQVNAQYALISGSRAEELSYELNVDGKSYGAMSWYLARQIRNAGGNATYRDIMDLVKAQVSGKYPNQHPQLEGRAQDNLVFSDKSRIPEPFVKVTKAGDKRITLAAGQVHGVTVGSLYDVYPPGAKSFSSAAPAQIKIRKIDVTHSIADVISGATIKVGARAVEREHYWPAASLKVHIMGLDSSKTLREVKQALIEFSHIDVIDTARHYDLLLREESGHIVTESGEPGNVSPPVPIGRSNTVSRLVGQVTQWASWFNLLKIGHTHSELDITFDIKAVSPAAESDSGSVSVSLSEGDQFSIEVTNNSDKLLYIAVLDLSSDGSVSVVYPTDTQEEYVAPGGGKWRRDLEAYVPEERESVRDVLKLIATTEYADFSFLNQPAVRGGVQLQASTRGGARNPLEQLVANASIGTTRGVKRVQMDHWIAVDRVLEVHR